MNLQRQFEITRRVCEAWPTYVGERVSTQLLGTIIVVFKDFRYCAEEVKANLRIPTNIFASQMVRAPEDATELDVAREADRCLTRIDAQLKVRIEQIVNG